MFNAWILQFLNFDVIPYWNLAYSWIWCVLRSNPMCLFEYMHVFLCYISIPCITLLEKSDLYKSGIFWISAISLIRSCLIHALLALIDHILASIISGPLKVYFRPFGLNGVWGFLRSSKDRLMLVYTRGWDGVYTGGILLEWKPNATLLRLFGGISGLSTSESFRTVSFHNWWAITWCVRGLCARGSVLSRDTIPTAVLGV